jgi:hypothetical protein
VGTLYVGEQKWIKIKEVSEALNQCQLLTDKLTRAVDDIAKSYAILQVERINEQLCAQ